MDLTLSLVLILSLGLKVMVLKVYQTKIPEICIFIRIFYKPYQITELCEYVIIEAIKKNDKFKPNKNIYLSNFDITKLYIAKILSVYQNKIIYICNL